MGSVSGNCAPRTLRFSDLRRLDMRWDSDIDLLVVRPDNISSDDEIWSEQLYELSDTVQGWTGNTTNILEFDENEIAERCRRRPSSGGDRPGRYPGCRAHLLPPSEPRRDPGVMCRNSAKAQPCDQKAPQTLTKAKQFLDAADILETITEGDVDVEDAYITMCVHSGIAAADVICCAQLGEHSTGENTETP